MKKRIESLLHRGLDKYENEQGEYILVGHQTEDYVESATTEILELIKEARIDELKKASKEVSISTRFDAIVYLKERLEELGR